MARETAAERMHREHAELQKDLDDNSYEPGCFDVIMGIVVITILMALLVVAI